MTPRKKRAKAKASKATRAPKTNEAQEVQQYFESLFRNNPLLMALSTLSDQRFSDVNRAFLKVLGYSRGDVIGKTTTELSLFPHPKQQAAAAAKLQADGRIAGFELQVRRKDGTVLDGLFSGELISSYGRQYFLTVMNDITARKQTEEEIRVLSKFPGENPNPVMRISRDGTLLYINEAGINLLTEYQLQTKKKVPPIFHRIVSQSLNNRSSREMNIEQGNRLYSFFIAPIVDAGYANLYGRDITDRKKIENMLQKQQEEQQIILDSVPAGIFYKDKENRFIRVNKILAEAMGMSREQLEGKSLFDLYPKERAEDYWKDDKEVMVSGKPKRNIIELLKTKKGSRWVQTDKIPYRDAQGNIVGIIGFTTDITERKQAETELKESHKQLRILSRHLQKEREIERARIAKELHDELGQTLTAIKIDYACLQKKLGLLQKPLGEEVKDLSGLIDTTINTVRKLTMDLRPAMLDDLGLIPAIEWMIKGVQKRSGIKSGLTVKPPRLKLDPNLSLTVFRITQEALTNIIRYARATRVQIVLERGPDCFNLMVKDNGIGIQQKQIKSYYSLGLVGMKERVMSYGGKLEINGEKGKGTTVKVFIPLEKGKSENTDS